MKKINSFSFKLTPEKVNVVRIELSKYVSKLRQISQRKNLYWIFLLNIVFYSKSFFLVCSKQRKSQTTFDVSGDSDLSLKTGLIRP